MAVERGIMGRFPYPFEKTPQKICRAAVQRQECPAYSYEG
jgi:hypothetical protein